jgi:hypothetical protein
MPNDPCEIRAFLTALLSNERATKIPRRLTLLAEAVSRHDGLTVATSDDLVGELLRRMVDHDMRQLRDDLARFTEADLERVLRFRLRQIAIEERPRWPLMRALRGHLRTVLETGLPEPDRLPASLEQNSRFNPALVAEAAAYFVAEGIPATVEWLASELMNHYFGPENSTEELGEPISHTPGPDVIVQLHHDGQVAAEALLSTLDERQRNLLALTCAERSLTDIARHTDVAVSTAFAWRGAMSRAIGSVAARLDADHETMEHALDLIQAA